jgi:hypothetical protein
MSGEKKAVTMTGSVHYYVLVDGDRLLTLAQHLVVPSDGRDEDNVMGTKV